MTTLAILIWPVMALFIFARLPAPQAVIWAVLLPYMFLPEAFSIPLPGLPDIDKARMISVGLLLGLIVHRQKLLAAERIDQMHIAQQGLRMTLWLCLVILVIGGLMTVLTNREQLTYGARVVASAQLKDVISISFGLILGLVPFWAATKYLATAQAHRLLLTAFAWAGLVYSVLMVIEVRLSPQLHFWVYGYYQHSFAQHIRDGFRPMVFLQHGLWVGFFAFTGVMATLGLWRMTQDRKWLWATIWLFCVLAISENVGALMIAIIISALFFAPKPTQLWAVLAIAAMILIYPTLRQSNILSTERLTNAVATIVSPARAGSFNYRLENEDLLLDKALEKPIFGWGGWGRSRVYTETGADISVTDGRWIIVLGQFGWVGYICTFSFLIFPLLLLNRTQKRKDIPIETLTLVMIGTGNLIYMIPNATLTPVGLLVFGAVAGFTVYDSKASAETGQPSMKSTDRTPRYTRASEPNPAARRGQARTRRFSRKGTPPAQ